MSHKELGKEGQRQKEEIRTKSQHQEEDEKSSEKWT